MGEEIKVSIVMTAYNVENYIERAILSVLNSTYKNIELIIVEDCSTDGTVEKIKSITDPRIKVIYHDRNLGAGCSRFNGIKAITGDYTLFVDSDDWIDNNWIEELVKAAIESNADITSGGMVVEIEKDDEIISDFLPVVECYLKKNQVFAMGSNISYRFLNLSLIRSTLWNKVEYCKWRFLEDSPTFIKLLSYANGRKLIPYVGYHYYQNPDSLCHVTPTAEKEIYRMKMLKDLWKFQEGIDNKIISPEHVIETFYKCKFSGMNLSKYKKEIKEIELFITKIIHEILWKEVETKEEFS
jgi:glycosyltransferase involved in cell wall biosynthesis